MKKLSILLAFSLIGCYSIVVQVIVIREFMVVFFGSELCLGIIFASWLIGISLGASIGGRLVKRFQEVLSLFILFQSTICLMPFFQIYLIRIVRDLLGILPGEYMSLSSLTSGTIFLIVPFSLLIGLAFPCACKINVGIKKSNAQQIGWIYIVESVGSLAGGLLLTFYMIAHFKHYETLSVISTLILVNGIILLVSFKKPLRKISLVCYIFLLISLSYFFISGNTARFDDLLTTKRWETYHNQLELIASLDSLYQNIVVAKREDQYSLFSNGQYVFSFPDPYQSAVFSHLTLSQHPHPRKVLLVGGGIAGITKEILKYPINLLHYVELDPKMVEAYLPYLPPEDKKAIKDTRVEIFHLDGRYYIKNTKEKYDLVILNLPDPSTAMLNRFYTLEFFEEVKEILSEGGVVVTSITSAVNYIGEEIGAYTGSLYHTLKKVFPYIVIVPEEKNYFFATLKPDVVTAHSKILAQRYRNRQISSDYFTPYHFNLLLPKERVEFIKKSLEKRSDVRINTDSHPITYFYDLVLWELFSGKRGGVNIFKQFSYGLNWIILLPLILFFIRVVYVVLQEEKASHHLKFNGLLAITTTGFAGMALEIILLFAFQNIYGYIYQKVGLIVALFMLGLALGGYFMNHLIAEKERNWIGMLIVIEFLICAYALSLPAIINVFSSHGLVSTTLSLEYLFMVLVAGAGILTGAEFPLVSRIFITHEEVGTVAGWVDSFDHLGACFGALLTGTMLVPLLGTFKSCFFTGALNLMSGLLLLIYLLQKRR